MPGHQYGPHDPTQHAQTVTVGLPGKWAGEAEVPLHPDTLAQREHINTRAHRAWCPGCPGCEAA